MHTHGHGGAPEAQPEHIERCNCGPIELKRRRRVHKALHAVDKGGIKKHRGV